MSLYQVFEQDKDYQNMVKDYFTAQETVIYGAKRGVFNPSKIKEQAENIQTEFEKRLHAFPEQKRETLQQEQATIKDSYTPEIDYTDNETKKLEVAYKLADNHELQRMVQDLNTADLKEIHLLRLELKSRNLEQEDRKVKQYTIANQLEKQHEQDERYNEINEELAVLNQVGSKGVVALGEYYTLPQLKQDFFQSLADSIKEGETKKPNLAEYQQAINEMRKAGSQ